MPFRSLNIIFVLRQSLHILISAPILAYPDFDRTFLLQTDASDVGIGVILAQYDGKGQERVIADASYTLSPREQKLLK